MPPSPLPPTSSLSNLPIEEQMQTLDILFEPSPELRGLAAAALSAHTFSSSGTLVEEIGRRLSTLATSKAPDDRSRLFAILGSHPRLGASDPVAKADLSEFSRQEQTSLNNNNNDDAKGDRAHAEDQATDLRMLNRKYEGLFPGLRYVTFVNGRPRDVIMQDMRRRIDRGDPDREIEDNIQAMCDIAKDRVRKLQQA